MNIPREIDHHAVEEESNKHQLSDHHTAHRKQAIRSWQEADAEASRLSDAEAYRRTKVPSESAFGWCVRGVIVVLIVSLIVWAVR